MFLHSRCSFLSGIPWSVLCYLWAPLSTSLLISSQELWPPPASVLPPASPSCLCCVLRFSLGTSPIQFLFLWDFSPLLLPHVLSYLASVSLGADPLSLAGRKCPQSPAALVSPAFPRRCPPPCLKQAVLLEAGEAGDVGVFESRCPLRPVLRVQGAHGVGGTPEAPRGWKAAEGGRKGSGRVVGRAFPWLLSHFLFLISQER